MQARTLDPADIKRQLRQFICAELMQQPSYPLGDDESLMSGGLIDSFCVSYIGVFIEDRFGVFVPDTDLTVECMDTLNRIATRVLQG